MDLAPQAGPQTDFLTTAADVAIFGGAAYGGKSFALLLEPLHYVNVKNFGAVIFRRTMKQVFNKGGLWDTAAQIYGQIPQAVPIQTRHKWQFPVSDVTFAHLEYESDIKTWDGPQIPMLGFDELQHFTREQFRYLLTRNRSTCGVKPYCRATCNPDPTSWILEIIGWYIGDDGFALKERSGVIRYLATYQDKFVTGADAEELFTKYNISRTDSQGKPRRFKTVTFIPSKFEDNPIGIAADPDYIANLDLQSAHEQARLRDGNWKVRKAGKLFKREWYKWIDPKDVPKIIRMAVGCDPSGGAGKNHDMQGIVKDGKGSDAKFYCFTDASCSLTPAGWGKRTVDTYHDEPRADIIAAEKNFGGDIVESTIRNVDAYANVKLVTASRGKAIRAEPIAALYEKGLVFHVGAKPELEDELVGFDPDDPKAPSPNRMDAHVWAMTELMGGRDAALDYVRWIKQQDALKDSAAKTAKEGTHAR